MSEEAPPVVMDEEEGLPLTRRASWDTSRLARLTEAQLMKPAPDDFDFSLEDSVQDATAMLEVEHLSQLRYKLVPARVSEQAFWRSLFYELSKRPEPQRAQAPSLTLPTGAGEPPRASGAAPTKPLNTAPPRACSAQQTPGGVPYTPCGTSTYGYEDDFNAQTPARRQ